MNKLPLYDLDGADRPAPEHRCALPPLAEKHKSEPWTLGEKWLLAASIIVTIATGVLGYLLVTG